MPILDLILGGATGDGILGGALDSLLGNFGDILDGLLGSGGTGSGS
ncbi:hypothetical protein [Rhodococcus sp. MEB064]|nr:hypothetical protein [Rhodococcus sp. MEB064]